MHIIVSDPDDPSVRYLHREKCTLDEPVNALAYKIVPALFERNGKTFKTEPGVVLEREPVQINAEAMANPKCSDHETTSSRARPGERTAAAEWLHDFLDGRDRWTERKAIIALWGKLVSWESRTKLPRNGATSRCFTGQ